MDAIDAQHGGLSEPPWRGREMMVSKLRRKAEEALRTALLATEAEEVQPAEDALAALTLASTPPPPADAPPPCVPMSSLLDLDDDSLSVLLGVVRRWLHTTARRRTLGFSPEVAALARTCHATHCGLAPALRDRKEEATCQLLALAGRENVGATLVCLEREATLRLTGNALCGGACGHLGVLLAGDVRLRDITALHLAGCEIGDRGARAFGAAARDGALRAIERWTLDANDITAEGFAALATGVGEESLPVLTELKASSNAAGDAGARALALALTRLPSCRSSPCATTASRRSSPRRWRACCSTMRGLRHVYSA